MTANTYALLREQAGRDYSAELDRLEDARIYGRFSDEDYRAHVADAQSRWLARMAELDNDQSGRCYYHHTILTATGVCTVCQSLKS